MVRGGRSTKEVVVSSHFLEGEDTKKEKQVCITLNKHLFWSTQLKNHRPQIGSQTVNHVRVIYVQFTYFITGS